MSGIRSRDTKPEMILRRGLHQRGFRFRLHHRGLPGTPDLVFPGRRAVLFAHGCFWHGHDCHLYRLPATRPDFWANKIERNRINDARAAASLANDGWRLGIVWECALRGKVRLPEGEVLDLCELWLRAGEHERNLELRGTVQAKPKLVP